MVTKVTLSKDSCVGGQKGNHILKILSQSLWNPMGFFEPPL
jgi:hypothetical protein